MRGWKRRISTVNSSRNTLNCRSTNGAPDGAPFSRDRSTVSIVLLSPLLLALAPAIESHRRRQPGHQWAAALLAETAFDAGIQFEHRFEREFLHHTAVVRREHTVAWHRVQHAARGLQKE